MKVADRYPDPQAVEVGVDHFAVAVVLLGEDVPDGAPVAVLGQL